MNAKRLNQASYYEASARARIAGLVDAGSFDEFCPPALQQTSPHLALLDAPLAFDDGVVVGSARMDNRPILIAAQEGRFNGGSVGEVHGAKIRGLLIRAVREKPAAVILLVDSGGVRLHEANAGLIAISEIMRALLDAQAAGIPVIAVVGGSCGAFGGMGIVTRMCDVVVMSEEGRLSLSGPEVIETVKGVGEFDAKDKALVWRTTGGKLRRTLGEVAYLVDDNLDAFRSTLAEILGIARPDNALAALKADQAALTARRSMLADSADGLDIWRRAGFPAPEQVPMLDTDTFNILLAAHPLELAHE